jgi:hypothetical protein
MRTLGIEIKGSDTLPVILDGTPEDGKIELLSPSKWPLPPDPEQINQLFALKKQVQGLLTSKKIESVGVVRADDGCSTIRAKIECIIQLAARDAGVPCRLVSALTVAAVEKRKLKEIAASTLQQALEQINPGYLRKAAYCAWSVINDGQK